MNRLNIITFLTANMRNAVIPFVTENKAEFGITTVTQSAVKAWINNSNTTDELLLELAQNCGYTADTKAPSQAPSVNGLTVENINVDTTNGTQDVPCYMLTVKKWDVSKAVNRTTGKVTYTPVLKLDIMGQTLSVHHELFRNKDVRDAISAGDIVAIREESVTIINGVNKQGQPYVAYRGAILEASVDAMGQARMALADREIALAGMSKEAQTIVNGSSAEQEAKAFFAKFAK